VRLFTWEVRRPLGLIVTIHLLGHVAIELDPTGRQLVSSPPTGTRGLGERRAGRPWMDPVPDRGGTQGAEESRRVGRPARVWPPMGTDAALVQRNEGWHVVRAPSFSYGPGMKGSWAAGDAQAGMLERDLCSTEPAGCR